MTSRIPRRSLLKAMASVALPAAALPRSSDARAEAGLLERYVTVFMPHGVALDLYLPDADFDFAPDSSLTPFQSAGMREQLLLVDGLDLSAGLLGGSAGHEGSRALFTGSARDGRNASLEQYLAVERGLGALTPLSSLVLGVGNADTSTSNSISYARGGNPLPKIIDPSQTYREAFARWIVGSDASELEGIERERKRGQSVLDALRGELGDLRARAGTASKYVLDQHLESLRAVELKLGHFELACAPPPTPAAFPALRAYQGGEPYFDAIADLQIDLLVAAFACGVTRFASLYLSDLSYTHFDPSLPDDMHEGVAHRYNPSNVESAQALAKQNRYAFSKLARLASALAGAGLLDTTLIHASSDMGDPAKHSSRRVPTLLLGGSAGGVRLGRVLDASVNGKNVPNNRLLVSIAQRFGVPVDSFGDFPEAEVVTGALDLSS